MSREDKQGGLKDAIGKILLDALSGRNANYRTTPEGFVRWGRVQDDMNAAIDAAFYSCAALKEELADQRDAWTDLRDNPAADAHTRQFAQQQIDSANKVLAVPESDSINAAGQEVETGGVSSHGPGSQAVTDEESTVPATAAPTPRTEAALEKPTFESYERLADFARQLERELAEKDARLGGILLSGVLDDVKCGDLQRWRDEFKAKLSASSASAALDAEWCVEAFWRVNPGRNATVPSLYLLDFAREVLRVHAPQSATEAHTDHPARVYDRTCPACNSGSDR